MSGSNDLLAQSLLAQVRQRPQQSMQSRLAAQMMEQATASRPIYNGNTGIALQGVQGLLAGFMGQYAQQGDEDREAKRLANAEQYQAQRDQASQARVDGILNFGANGGRPGQASPAEAPAETQQAAPGAPHSGPVDLAGYTPPGGTDRNLDLLTRTLIGEAGNQGLTGQAAVAAVVRNRAMASGTGLGDVVLAPGQFEPWGNPATRARLLAINPDSSEYRRARTVAEQVISGEMADPTNGSTHFFAPRAQAALGRPAPSWATGEPTVIGDHNFYRLPYTGQGRHGLGAGQTPVDGARAVLAAPNGAPMVTPVSSGGGSAPPARQTEAPGPDYRTRALAAASSSDPNVQRLAPILMQMAQRGERTNPIVEIDGPQGPGSYERLPGGQLRFVGGRLPPQPSPRQPNPDYEAAPEGGLRPIPGGPADPAAVERRAAAARRAATMPAGLQTQEAEDLTAIGTASGINERLTRFSGMIENETAGRGEPGDRLALGPVQNLVSGARNTTGMSSPNSANYASFRAELERLRNESLRLNTGVQTDGDAQRAWNELVTNINDPAVVRQRLTEIQAINVRGMALREALVQNRRAANGLPELDTGRFRSPGPDATAVPQNAPRTAAPAGGGGGWSIRPAQ